MRLAFSADARRLAFDERYRSALASSFSNVELGGFRAGDAALSRALAGALRGLGLRLSVHLPHDYRPAGPSHSRLALAEGLRWLELAAGLGAERAVVHATHTPPERVARALCSPRASRARGPSVRRREALDARALRSLARRAEDVGVGLFVENVDPFPRSCGRAPAWCCDPLEVSTLADGLGLGVCLDMAHAARGGHGAGALAAGPRHLHVSGVDSAGHSHLALDRNERVDLDALDRYLRGVGGGAWAVLETRSLGAAVRSRALMGW